MRSTQRNESVNNTIKTYITSCKRTNFYNIINIFNEIKKGELQHVKC